MNADIAIVLAWLLAVAVIAASARTGWRFLRTPAARRPRGWRIAALLLVQVASAVLLYRALFPPTAPAPVGLLVVATAGADAVPAARGPAARTVAMPEAPALPAAARMPDLATALRRHPGTTRVRVLGAGLVPRDLEAARGLDLEFRPAPLPRGLVALWPPRDPRAGRRFEVGGRTHGLAGGQAELLDPAQAIVARARPDDDGRFRLTAVARDAGPATWTLRLRGADGAIAEQLPLALDVAPGARLRVLVLAGAPDPELKFLRRWASDADLALDTRIELGAGMQIGDAPARLDAATLAGYDLVVLDQRSWQALGDRRGPLLQAVRGGLGLLLRLPRATGPGDRTVLRQLGFEADNGTVVPMLADTDGTPRARWRAQGLGRIGVAAFDHSYRLVLAGDGDRHGDLWAQVFSTLARARAAPGARIEGPARVGERISVCGLPADAMVDAPDGGRTRLHLDPASGARACAGLWPRVPGWHLLRAGEAIQRFHVQADGAAPGLRAARLHDDTARLAAAPSARRAGAGPAVSGPRWPWFLAWLALAAAGWWLERSFMRKSPDMAP